ncbi:MAG: cobalt-factor II C(20)-methyltransferase [Methanocalculus sp.]|uniref:cobalt-factor II C(20)-methyltransferase n=1 Tax=Methanocalculus sp. TaxID=2004547 RepID=UPI0027159ADE|nr:cobalt-factor II C(20)-methyltransferase [Methanocalculus sp.]MDO9539704.1 cobalt-factor II C(20)-methyltransferase [Methanocalculus sp.]
MLIAVGLGPGDPELLTIKAVRLLREADAVFVPGEMAYNLVEPYRSDAVTLDFPMTSDESYIEACMEENAKRIAPYAMKGTAIFGIIGDPNFFSTFSRLTAILKRDHPEIECETVPGISSITAFASVAGVPISRSFSVSDGSDPDVSITLKVRHPKQAAERLRGEGYSEFILVERMFMEGMAVFSGNELPDESSYFSILYARK